jgi:hypothetical protein
MYAAKKYYVTLMMEEIQSSEKSVLIRATRRNIPEDGILHSHRSEILEPYTGFPYLLNEFIRDASHQNVIYTFCSSDTFHTLKQFKERSIQNWQIGLQCVMHSKLLFLN